jgi:hypothetical protein
LRLPKNVNPIGFSSNQFIDILRTIGDINNCKSIT